MDCAHICAVFSCAHRVSVGLAGFFPRSQRDSRAPFLDGNPFLLVAKTIITSGCY
jgi:hypothetical protein